MRRHVLQRRRRDTEFSVPPECGEMIRRGALVALNVSGGKDSQALTIILSRIVPPTSWWPSTRPSARSNGRGPFS